MTPDQAQRIHELHYAWTMAQVAKGVDGPVPSGRKDGSDYNQHYPDLEASGADQDEYHNQVRAILDLPPLA